MHCSFCYVCYHRLCSPATGKKKYINFMMTFSHFSLKKNNKQKLAYILSFFKKNYKEHKEFVFKYCSFLYGRVRGKKKFTNHVKLFSRKTLYFTEWKSTEPC